MLISEIFYSIQGEGELTGVPSVFIRTSGCNLRCRWCDTEYASWDPAGENFEIEEIVARVKQFKSARHCVITGGEPMVAKGIHQLTAALKGHGYHITIETAGTVLPEGIACDLASLSPKLANSTPSTGKHDEWLPDAPDKLVVSAGQIEKHEKLRLQPEIIRAWVEAYPFQLKFVVAEVGDLEQIEELLGSVASDIDPLKILLMPEGITPDAIRGRDESLIDLCKDRGYRYCNRLHIELFGNTRGT